MPSRRQINALPEAELMALNANEAEPVALRQYIACLLSQRSCKAAGNQDGVSRYQERMDRFWAEYRGSSEG